MPWSGSDYAQEWFFSLSSMPAQIASEYVQPLEILSWLVHSDEWYDIYAEDYIALLEALIAADQEWVRGSYAALVTPEMETMKQTDHSIYEKLRSYYPWDMESPADPVADRTTLEKNRSSLLLRLKNSAAVLRYQSEQKTKEANLP